MTTQTQSTLEMYKSVLSKFNLNCELSLLYENLVYIYKDDNYLGAFDLTTGEITSYGLDLPVETMNQIVEEVNNYLVPQVEQEKTEDDLAWEEACRADDEAWQNNLHKTVEQITEARELASLKIRAEKKLKSQPLTVTNRSLREQTLDASAKILQHSLGNMMFSAEGLHPISDSTIHIQLDGGNDELDISFWYLLGAFKTNDPDQIDDKLCAALFHHGKIDCKICRSHS